MSNSVENPPSLDSLEEDSDELIELTEEVSSPTPVDDLALAMPEFKLPGTNSEAESPADESFEDEDEDFDREDLVRTSKMEAFDRGQIELLDSVRKWKVADVLTDQRFAPDVLVGPPRVLTKKWRDEVPVAAPVTPDPETVDTVEEPANRTNPQVEHPPAPPKKVVEETLELDAEELEEEVETAPPKRSPPPAAPPKVTQVAGRQRVHTKPIPKREAQATPPPMARGEDDMNGIVQELLEENKVRPSQTPAELKRQNWFVDVFGEEYLRTLPKSLRSDTDAEVNFIIESLGVKPGARVFDLACGFGRHSIELAQRNFEVAGLDVSMPLLQRALSEAQRRSLSIKFIHGDMRELNFSEIFDACFLWQTSFGYFDDKTNFRVLQGIHRSLKQGGRFLLDVVNRDYVIAEMPSRTWWEGLECVFLEEVEFDYTKSIVHTKRSFIYEDGSPPQEFSSYVRLYGLHELYQILNIAGFDVIEVTGELFHRGSFLGPASSRLIVLAEKR